MLFYIFMTRLMKSVKGNKKMGCKKKKHFFFWVEHCDDCKNGG